MTRRAALDGLLVGTAAAVVHGRSITFGFTNLDDRDLVVDDQPFLTHPDLLGVFTRAYMHVLDAQHSYYRPLVTLSYALDAQWSGVRALGYHLTNVVLHVLASLLFLLLLHRLSLGPIVTRGAALVFAVHPVLASAVAWIPGRNDSLLAVFALLSWLLFLRAEGLSSWSCRGLHLAAFTCALWTKETAVVIPLVCLAHLALVDPDTWIRLRRSRALVAMVCGWAAAIMARAVVHLPAGSTLRELVRNLPVCLTSIGQLAIPVDPSLIHVRSDVPVWPGLVTGALGAAAVYLAPGVRKRVVALGAVAFVLFLGPALAVPGELVLESRLYLPACGVLVAIAEIVRATARDRAPLVAFGAVTIAVLGAVTTAYEGTFRDRRAFAQSAVAGAPRSALAHFCLGQTYQVDGDLDRALAEYRIALAFGASYTVHNNIAVIHMASARWTEAETELREELALDPGYARAYRNLGVVLRRLGRIDEALLADRRADDLAPATAH